MELLLLSRRRRELINVSDVNKSMISNVRGGDERVCVVVVVIRTKFPGK